MSAENQDDCVASPLMKPETKIEHISPHSLLTQAGPLPPSPPSTPPTRTRTIAIATSLSSTSQTLPRTKLHQRCEPNVMTGSPALPCRKVSKPVEEDRAPVVMDWDAPLRYHSQQAQCQWDDYSLKDDYDVGVHSYESLSLSNLPLPVSVKHQASEILEFTSEKMFEQNTLEPFNAGELFHHPYTEARNFHTTPPQWSEPLPAGVDSSASLERHHDPGEKVVGEKVAPRKSAASKEASTLEAFQQTGSVSSPSQQRCVPREAYKVNKPRTLDVICTKHKTSSANPGNEYYLARIEEHGRFLAKEFLSKYIHSELPPQPWKSQKSNIAREIVEEIRTRGGMFLSTSKKVSYYWDIGDVHAQRKTEKLLTSAAEKIQVDLLKDGFPGRPDPRVVTKLNQIQNANLPSVDEALKLLTIPPKPTTATNSSPPEISNSPRKRKSPPSSPTTNFSASETNNSPRKRKSPPNSKTGPSHRKSPTCRTDIILTKPAEQTITTTSEATADFKATVPSQTLEEYVENCYHFI